MTSMLWKVKSLILMVLGVMLVGNVHAEQYLMYEVRTDGRKTMVHPRAAIDPSRHDALVSQLCKGGGLTAVEIRRGDTARIRDRGEEPRLIRIVPCGVQSISAEELDRETQVVARQCNENYTVKQFADCDCVIKKFPEIRRAHPTGHLQTSEQKAMGLCIDSSRMRRTFYERCADMWKNRDPSNYQSYCNCIADRGVQSFERNRRSPDSINRVEIDRARNDAMRQCAR